MAAKRFAMLVHNEFEDLELWYPVLRLREAGAVVHIAGEEVGYTYTGKHGLNATADIDYEDVDPDVYDGLLIPGGWAPDKLRRYTIVVKLVREFDEANAPIGQICHAGWVLISAGILNGRKVTSTPAIKDDMENAGAKWIDKSAVVDGNLVSAQRPPDLPNFMKLYLKVAALI